jgi:hypothetical protein
MNLKLIKKNSAFDYITGTVRKRTVLISAIGSLTDIQSFNVLARHCIILVRTDTDFFLNVFFTALQHDRKTCVLLTDINHNQIKLLKMKKTILSIVIGLALFSTAFANAPEKATDRAIASFVKEFKKASDVSWSANKDYIMAAFELDNQTQYAYYDYQGNLVGVVHHILTSSLPADLNRGIRKHYSGYWVSELFQLSSDQGDAYYIQLKNADETLVLTTEGTGSWHLYSAPKAIVTL